MKPTKAQLREAITSDLEKRWIPIRNAKSCDEMADIEKKNPCACHALMDKTHLSCPDCPARKKTIINGGCLTAWYNFWEAINVEDNNLHKARYNATLLIKRLKKELEMLS